MDNFLTVFKREYLERVRSKWFVIVSLLVPVAFAGMLLIPAWMASKATASAETRNIKVLDASGTGLGEVVIAQLTRRDSAARADTTTRAPARRQPQLVVSSMSELPAAEEAAMNEVRAKNSLTGYLVLTDSILATGRARYAGRNASSIADIERLQSAVRQAVMIVRLQRENVRPEIIAQMTRTPVRLDAERLSEKGRGGSGRTGIIVGYALAILLYMSIILHGQNILRGVLEEKTTRVAEVVLSSVKADTLLYGKVLGVGMVGLTQQVMWFGMTVYLVYFFAPMIMPGVANAGAAAGGASAEAGAMTAAFDSLSWSLGAAVLLFFLAGFFFYGALFAGFGAMVNSEQEAQQAVMPVMMLLIGTIVMLSPVMLNPNGRLAVVLSWLPFSSPIIMPTRMALNPVPLASVVGSIVVCFIGAAGAIWFAARIYRVGMLMYGKRPTLKEMIKWVRYA